MNRIILQIVCFGLLPVAFGLAAGSPVEELPVTGFLEQPRAETTLSTDSSLSPLTFKNYPFAVPAGASQITVSIANGSGNLDLYVKKSSGVMGGTIGELEADADFVSNGPTANEQIIVTTSSSPVLAAGTWYIAVLNRNSTTTSFTIRVVVVTPDSTTSSSFTPQVGLWINPEASGHGVDLQYTLPTTTGQVTLSAVFYTYEPDRSPTWYQALGTLNGPTWTADVLQWSWNGSKATSTKVGTVTAVFSDRTHARFSWTINGNSFSEDMERFVVADGVPPVAYTGLWFQKSKSGFGYSVDTQGSGTQRTEAIVAYIYGCKGEPRWVITIINGATDTANTSYPSLMFSGSCPWCPFSASTPVQVGTLKRSYTSPGSGTMVNQFTLPAPVSCTWNMNIPDLKLLSAGIDEQLLEMELVLDEVLGLVNTGGDAIGEWSDVLTTVLGGGSTTCPTTTQTGPTGSGTPADPLKLSLSASFGSGCTGADDATWSGGGSVVAEVVLGTSNLSLDADITLDNLTRDRTLIGNGTANAEVDLVVAAGNKADGTASLTATGSSADGPVSGTIDVTLDDVDISLLFAGLSGGGSASSLSLDSLLDALGSTGEIMVDFNNVKAGQASIDGELLFSAVSAIQQTLDVNLTTNQGPLDILMNITNTAGTAYTVNTPSAGSVAGYTVRMQNLKFDTTQCEKAPTGGSAIIGKDGKSVEFAFDGTCVGYKSTKL